MFFNNCGNRKHTQLYGGDAFFDLGTEGYEGGLATSLRKGDLCIVASYNDARRTQVAFQWYEFVGVTMSKDEYGEPQRVFRGNLLTLIEY